jgi:tripartite-type tricarboxylate transporter receptor subunit TctC
MAPIANAVGPLKDGRLTALGVSSKQRDALLPDVPTAAEAGLADCAVSGWYGLVAPAKTPRAIIDRVHAEAAKALKNEAVQQRLATSGSIPIGGGPEELDKHIRSEIVRWNRVLTAAGVQPTN